MPNASGGQPNQLTSVAWLRLPGSCPRRWDDKYRVHMRDGSEGEPPNTWADYLRELVSRPGWSVARLARESGIHRSTIFRWMEGGEAKTITVRSVKLIAAAAGADVDTALRAAGAVLDPEEPDNDFDLQVEMIERSDLPASQKRAMIREAERLRQRQLAERKAFIERQTAEREQTIKTWLEIARGDNPQPAT